MDVYSFISQYNKRLIDRMDDISQSITSGSVSDWEDYKARVGEIQGVAYEGGIYVPDQVRDRESKATVVAYVVKVGPLAYKDADKFGGGDPWCKVGDWVCIGRYAGSRFSIEGGEVRIINDDEVIATIVDPDDIKSYGG
jgi:co-chaperonin GroES (HSP10)